MTSPPDRASGGWVMVPRNPTSDMLDAGGHAMFVDVKRKDYCGIVRRGYKAMLAASPVAPRDEKLREALAELVKIDDAKKRLALIGKQWEPRTHAYYVEHDALSKVIAGHETAMDRARALLEDEK